MFEASETPSVFAVPPGIDFPASVISGLERVLRGKPPEAWARTHILGNSRRMLVRLRDVLEAGPPRLLPKLTLITDLEELPSGRLLSGGTQVPALRRQLDLARLLRPIEGFATSGTAFDIAGSLATLLDEMAEEAISKDALITLDVGQHSKHWARSLEVLKIATDFDTRLRSAPSSRDQVQTLISRWAANPPQAPILAVGSTGSRGATAKLLEAVARLPNGAVILPGFDPNTPQDVWARLLDDNLQDHPQYRYAALLGRLGLDPLGVPHWTDTAPPSAQRNKVISLALRPAPVTNEWLSQGPMLGDLGEATAGFTLLEARDQRQEANAIALRMRSAAEAGERVALISPDRALTRRVSAALDRWNIVADDSAGLPLSLTAPGRLLRQVAGLAMKGISADTLIALLKHPLVASTEGLRGPHLLMTRALELHLRKRGIPFPTLEHIARWTDEDETRAAWGTWLNQCVVIPELASLDAFWAWLRKRTEHLAAGPAAEGNGALWEEAPGRAANETLAELETVSDADDLLSETDPLTILKQTMGARPMNIQNVTHPGLTIWGTLDARAQGAQLVILGGLNDGSWPEAAAPDPWLNRDMRRKLGLRSPERQIGLSAHDFQQAIAAPEVWLTRATKSDDAETVPSRWLNRITTMLDGLAEQNGKDALEQMRERATPWIDRARRLDIAREVPKAARPAPIPPASVRPKRLSVTEIKTLIRDPYAIYAKHLLRLRPLDPLVGEPDALLRGTVLHSVMEQVVAAGLAEEMDAAIEQIARTTDETLARHVPWTASRKMWKARMMRVAPWFVTTERQRSHSVTTSALEARGALTLAGHDFTLTGTADRIDMTADGRARIFDYKTGTPPTKKQQEHFEKQLLLEAIMAERGAFGDTGPVPVERAAFIGLGASPVEVDAPVGETDAWAQFEGLIARVLGADHGFTARRAMQNETDEGQYDLLSRFGEWSTADTPEKTRL